MFTWKVEDQRLRAEGIERVERTVSKSDKLEFLDREYNGIGTYILNLIHKYEEDIENGKMKLDVDGCIIKRPKTVSLIAWLKKNDPRKIVDRKYHYGKLEIRDFGIERYIQCDPENRKGNHESYSNIIDEMFHEALANKRREEIHYFEAHDEYQCAKAQLRLNLNKFPSLANLIISSNGSIKVKLKDGIEREITLDEVNMLNEKYKELEEHFNRLRRTVVFE